jgi:CRISPR-associated endonuclease/helicase Cas3
MDGYSDFFFQATNNSALPYQIRLHESPAQFTALSIPTGLGKTDAVLTDWLARRPTTRLAWCLPGRALTKQTADTARKLVKRTGLGVRVTELMGGSEDNDARLYPDEPAILVGTQDILTSRALNRGYARNPFRWPVDFALLNNDIAWVFDEIQLLGDSLATSTQIAAFRARFGVFGAVPCTWMSATFDLSWLRTVDFGDRDVRVVDLDKADLETAVVRERLGAAKEIRAAPVDCRLPKGCAHFVAESHAPGTLTLVIANTVQRAREIHAELEQFQPVLLHSRFRPADREKQLRRVLDTQQGIVVSTQVIEAGIDIDADLMVTDAAPWPSLVQRFGRVNRYGKKASSRIYWVDRPLTGKRKNLATAEELKPKDEEQTAAPYEAGSIREALLTLNSIDSASPGNLPKTTGIPPYAFVLRRADLMDLFDTTPDLAGNQIDVSRFVRSGKENDIYVAWRDWPARKPPDNVRLEDREVCTVPLGEEFRKFLKKHGGWAWQYTRRGGWREIAEAELYPGLRVLFRTDAGGYDVATGWRPDLTSEVERIAIEAHTPEQAHDDDMKSEGRRQTLAEHTSEVVAAAGELIERLGGLDLSSYREAILAAARRHDWGKAHPIFQQTLHNLDAPPAEAPAELLAKQERGRTRPGGHSRNWFRHELASALAMLQAGDSPLAAYVAAAHHGKVRLSIRSMPGERVDGSEAAIARGVQGGDRLFAANLGGGYVTPEITLALEEAMRFGGWTEQVLGLLEQEGPFRLAFLEMILRAADERASAHSWQEEQWN